MELTNTRQELEGLVAETARLSKSPMEMRKKTWKAFSAFYTCFHTSADIENMLRFGFFKIRRCAEYLEILVIDVHLSLTLRLSAIGGERRMRLLCMTL